MSPGSKSCRGNGNRFARDEKQAGTVLAAQTTDRRAVFPAQRRFVVDARLGNACQSRWAYLGRNERDIENGRTGIKAAITIVAGDLIDEQGVFEVGPPAAIVDDHIAARWRYHVRDQRNMRAGMPVLRAIIGDDIAGPVVLGDIGRRKIIARADEEAAQRFSAAVID